MKKKFILTGLCFIYLLLGASDIAVRGQESGKTADAMLIPILGNYPNTNVAVGGSAAVLPDTGASGISNATVTVSGNFKGAVTISPSSGAVRVTNASPAGTYALTVRGSDFAGYIRRTKI